jgi:protein-L-isoaspartate(D-aspartate) O-methyltransferase
MAMETNHHKASDDPYAGQRRALIEALAQQGITSGTVLAAMARVPRERFVGEALRDQAFIDAALPIAEGQTISQPFMVAMMTQALELTGHERVLEIGTGSGYQAAILAECAGSVVSIERSAALAEEAQTRLRNLGYNTIEVHVADGSKGWPAGAPYDRILVTAGAPVVPPSLQRQVADGGMIVIPVGSRSQQRLMVYRRRGDEWESRQLGVCVFVPLVGAEAWPIEDMEVFDG